MIVVSFNLRRDVEEDGENRFENRKHFVAETILHKQPDIIGFQEALPEMAAFLKEALADYTVLGCGRDKQLQDEYTLVAVKRARFDVMEMRTMWLSHTPHKPGSRYREQSICPRTCTMVLLWDLQEKEPVRIYNTHLDHIGSGARLLGARQILKTIPAEKLMPQAPVVVMGDFNALPEDPEVRVFSREGSLVDLTASVGGTFHDFGKLSPGEKIDYIFADSRFTMKKAGVWTERNGRMYLSDHDPVFVEMSTK
ncbi:MAG: endonuclease/exonuclease/phosphatase family protein [Lachnospiraceae bacterium]|nr:endonuclease/exonuclease/phosphatase family protein [Lachnospiraceae bacterium]